MSKKKQQIIEPPVDESLIPVFTDPPLTPHGDLRIDEKGHLVEEPVAKTFKDVLAEMQEADDWSDL